MSPAEVRSELDCLIIERRNYFAGWLYQQSIPGQDVDDFLNDCYVIACLHVDGYRGEGTVLSWFFAIVRNTLFSCISSRRQLISLTGDYSLASDSAARHLRQVETSIDVELLLSRARMTRKQKSAIRSFMNGEIVDNSRKSKNAHHAVRKLRRAARVVRCGR